MAIEIDGMTAKARGEIASHLRFTLSQDG